MAPHHFFNCPNDSKEESLDTSAPLRYTHVLTPSGPENVPQILPSLETADFLPYFGFSFDPLPPQASSFIPTGSEPGLNAAEAQILMPTGGIAHPPPPHLDVWTIHPPVISSVTTVPEVGGMVTGLDGFKAQLQWFREARDLPCDYEGLAIPQEIYFPHTERDQTRYVNDAELLSPIYFWRGRGCGILVTEILAGRPKELKNPDEVVFEGTGPSISIRIKWPGYPNWSRQVSAKDFRKVRSWLPRHKVASVVAKKIECFFKDVQKGKVRGNVVDSLNKSMWNITANHIRLEDIILVSLQHVSKGSWQPVLRLRR